MSDRYLTDKIRSDILSNGMDLVGFAPVSRWEHAPFLLSPQAILPNSKTVVVAAIHITDTWTEMGGEPEPQDRSAGGWMDQNGLLDRIAYRTARLLSDHGHEAVAVASSNIWRYREYEGIPSLFAPDLSHIHAAAAAGLAEIGWSGLAITPEFGARCRFISIVTSAELVATPMYDGPKLCDMCGECIKHCPTAALRKELGKPHEVKIGGKTYRYANKNMWRCAWAEHFDLDLNSKKLKELDKVGETEILQEIAEKGKRGHERGVCQKFCVPPHLRTNMPSFGRSEKLIAQNRIKRRYPENMPTLRKMRDDISAAAIRMGAEIVSVAPLKHDVQTVPGYTVTKELPGAKTIIAMAIRIPPSFKESSTDSNYATTMMIPYLLMHQLCLKTARMVEDYGYGAASYSWHDELGEMAGIGKREKLSKLSVLPNGKGRKDVVLPSDGKKEHEVLISPELGDTLIVGVVVTDAPLDPTPVPEKCDAPSYPKIKDAKKLRKALENIAEKNLVSLFGIAPVKRFEKTIADLKKEFAGVDLGELVYDKNTNYHGIWESTIANDGTKIKGPGEWLPGAKSVIVIGMHFLDEIVRNAGHEETQQIGTYAFWQYQTYRELSFAAFALAKSLDNQGYKAVVCDNMLGIGSKVCSHRGMLPDARCNAIEGVAAGLGQLGENGSLLTEAYGAQQRLMVVVTDAELPADELYSGQALCKKCGKCQSKCPMKALSKKSFNVHLGDAVIEVPQLDRMRCDWSKRYGLCKEEGPAMIGNKTDVPKPKGKVTIDEIAKACVDRDPIMKNRPCILESCLQHCPAGSEKAS